MSSAATWSIFCRFESTLTVQNNGLEELKSWKVFVGFQHDELLVELSNAVLADGSTLPAKVGNGTILAGFPDGDLETAVETAGDLNQMRAVVQLVGTHYKVPNISLPANISLVNPGYSCPSNYTMPGAPILIVSNGLLLALLLEKLKLSDCQALDLCRE